MCCRRTTMVYHPENKRILPNLAAEIDCRKQLSDGARSSTAAAPDAPRDELLLIVAQRVMRTCAYP